MKTIIHNPEDLTAIRPVRYPCLVTKDGDVALAINPCEGIRLHGSLCQSVAGCFDTGNTSWAECGWEPITKPVTITFTP